MPLRDTASAQPFLSPAERRKRAREVDAIVKLAADGKYPAELWPVAASVGFGPDDLKRLPVDVAAGIAAAQQTLARRPAPVGRNLAALVELCGIEALLHEDSADLAECLEKATGRSAMLFLARSMRSNETAAGEQVSHASANVTAVEAQRSGNTAARLTASFLRLRQERLKLEIDAGKAERDGILLPEVRRDDTKRGRRIRDRIDRDRSREEAQKRRDEHELALALEAAAEDAATRRSPTGHPIACPTSAATEDHLLSPQRGERPEGTEGGEPRSRSLGVSTIDVDEDQTTSDHSEHQPPRPEPSPLRPFGARSPLGGEKTDSAPTPDATPYTVSVTPLLSPQRGQGSEGAELGEKAGLTPIPDATPYTVSGTPLFSPLRSEGRESESTSLALTTLPLPLADRRAAASDALLELQRPRAAKDDPANGWEVEALGIAVKTGLASASIVARFVEEATTTDIFPEPGSNAGRRPTYPEFIGRLSPRGWSRVTATGSSSVSLMA